MYVSDSYKFKRFENSALPSCVSHSIDICAVAITNNRNMRPVSTNQVADN